MYKNPLNNWVNGGSVNEAERKRDERRVKQLPLNAIIDVSIILIITKAASNHDADRYLLAAASAHMHVHTSTYPQIRTSNSLFGEIVPKLLDRRLSLSCTTPLAVRAVQRLAPCIERRRASASGQHE